MHFAQVELPPSHEEPLRQDAVPHPGSRLHASAAAGPAHHGHVRSADLSLGRAVVDGYLAHRALDPKRLHQGDPALGPFRLHRGALLAVLVSGSGIDASRRLQNQFFITSTEVEGTIIENKLGDALVSRIVRAHSEGTPWRAIIVIPMIPGCASFLYTRTASRAYLRS